MPPRLGTRDIERPRLTARLDLPRRRPLSIVVASSGSGKTTLVARWASDRAMPVAWLSLDSSDNSPTVLGFSLIEAVRAVAPGFGRDSLVMVIGGALPDAAGIGATMAEEIAALGGAMALVIDDAHELTSDAAWDVVETLLAHAGDLLHIVITSRASLPIDLTPFRAAGRLVELDTPALRFTSDEAASLALAMGADHLSAEAIAGEIERSGGWAALLRMLLGRREARSADFPIGEVDDVLDRLVGLALDYATPSVRQAALWSSLAPAIDEQVLGTMAPPTDIDVGAVTLPALAALGLPMVRSGQDGDQLEFHAVVRRALRARLAMVESPDAIAAAHLRAAAAYRAAGAPIEAVRQALAGGDEALAVEIAAEAGFAAMRREGLLDLALLVEELPPDAADRYPVVAMLACWAAYRLTNATLGEAIGRYMRTIERVGESDGRWAPKRVHALVEVLAGFGFSGVSSAADAEARADRIAADLAQEDVVARGVLYGITGPIVWTLDGGPAGIAYLEKMLAGMTPDMKVERAVTLQGLTLILDLHGAPVSKVTPLLEEIASLSRSEGLPLGLGVAATSLGWQALRRLDLAAAASWFGDTIDDAYLAGANLWRQARYGEVMLAALSGRADDALERIDDEIRILRRLGVDDWIMNADAFRARIAMLVGRTEIALAWIDATGTGTPDVMPALHEAADLTRARVLLAYPTAERIADAGSLLDRLATHATNVGFAKLQEPIALCRALIAEVRGRREEAIALIAPALETLALREDLLTLVEHGPALAPALALCRERGIAVDYLDRVAAGRAALPLDHPGVVPPRLNDIALMVSIADGRSFDEIAVATGVSVNVVRSNVRRLFRELGASSRSDAVARARARGMLT